MTATTSSAAYEFSIPARKPSGAGNAGSGIDSVKQWLDDLPSANIMRVAPEISQRLHTFNHSDISAHQRLQLLHLIQPLAGQSIEALLAYITGHSFPLAEKYLLAAAKLESLTRELADAYLLTVNDLVNGRDDTDVASIDTAIFMAMQYLGRQLYHSYLLYSDPPPGIWLRIHQLYKCAADHSLLHKQTTGNEDTYSTRYPTEALYKKFLLLHLAGPHRLRQPDLARLETILRQCAELGILYKSTSLPRDRAVFSINPDRDRALTRLCANTESDLSGNTIHFSAIPLAKQVSQRIHSPQEDNAFQPLPVETCKRLMLSWGVLSKRLFSRKSIQGKERKLMAAGMVNTHYYINNEELFVGDGSITSGNVHKPHAESRINNIPGENDVWDQIHTSPGASDFFSPDEHIVMQSSITRCFSSQIWELVNESAGGYCLRSGTDIPECISVGELVSIKTIGNSENSDWEIGVIRWIKTLAGEKIEVGVQMIAPSACALAISGAKQQTQPSSRAFLLPDIQAVKQPASIITPGMPYACGDIIDLCQGDKTERVKLLRMLDDTGSYRQFEFKKLGSLATANQ